SVDDYVKHVDQGFDVVDECRLAEQARLHREGWLVAWLPALAFDRVEERGLLAADISARTASDLDLEIEVTVLPSLFDCALDSLPSQRVLAPDVEKPLVRAGRKRGDRHRLDHCERIALHELPIFESSGFGLVRVAHNVVRAGRLFRDRGPFPASRKRSASSPEQLCVGHLADDTIGTDLHSPTQRCITSVFEIAVNALGIN